MFVELFSKEIFLSYDVPFFAEGGGWVGGVTCLLFSSS